MVGDAGASGDHVAETAATLQLLFNDDVKLLQYGVSQATPQPDKVAFPYAASLLEELSPGGNTCQPGSTKQKAELALLDVRRKLALVGSMSLKLSRTSPETVAGDILRLHGYHVSSSKYFRTDASNAMGPSTALGTQSYSKTTLTEIMERSDRLERQADSLENVARRIENSVYRGLTKTETETIRLSRILKLSYTLKKIALLQFEVSKLKTYELDDPRDLIRAAASVSVLEELLQDTDFAPTKLNNVVSGSESILSVECIRPHVIDRAVAVRAAAAALLNELMRSSIEASTISEAGTTQLMQQLGISLQVYYHLGELHAVVWKLMRHAHNQVEKETRRILNPATLSGLYDQARKSVQDAKLMQTKLNELREDLARTWANSVLISATFIRNLHRVLLRQADHIKRISYINVVAAGSIPNEYLQLLSSNKKLKNAQFSLYHLFWANFCSSLFSISENNVKHESDRYLNDVAEFYPSIQFASRSIVNHLIHTGSNSMLSNPASMCHDEFVGILGGSIFLNERHLHYSPSLLLDRNDNVEGINVSDMWTVASGAAQPTLNSGSVLDQRDSSLTFQSINSFEWFAVDTILKNRSGLSLLKKTFATACFDRLCAPLQYMFPSEDLGIDSDGVAIASSLSLLPSKYDIQRFDETIRKELSLANGKEGSDLLLVSLVAEAVVSMIDEFCFRTKRAMSGVDGETKYLLENLSISDSLERDRKLVCIMHSVNNYLDQAAEKTYTKSGQSSNLLNRQAIQVCQEALSPAFLCIDVTVKDSVIFPLCRALNRKIFECVSRIQQGVYLSTQEETPYRATGFVCTKLAPLLETIACVFLPRFPARYGSVFAERLVSFTVYSYLSTLSLVREIDDSTRLRMTQDLTDLEMALEQLVARCGSSLLLQRVDDGRPYSELRAVRQMLFWTGLQQNKDWSAHEIVKSLLQEFWITNMRPSTLFHYLFSFGSVLLSSPHHTKRIKAEEYVMSLVSFDGNVGKGENLAWIIIKSCCDSYTQRASTATLNYIGDPRIAQVVLKLAEELSNQKGP